MLTLYLVAALAALCAALYAYVRHSLTYWQRRKVPVAAASLPFGDYADFLRDRKTLGGVTRSLYRRHRDQRYLGTYFLTTPLLQLHDPEIIRHVFVKEFQDFNGRGFYNDVENDPLSGHLFRLSGQPWRNLRVKLSPTFTTGKIKYMFSTIQDCADALRQHVDASMKEGGGAYEEDVRELVARFSTDVISSAAFGIESNSMKNPDSEFRRMGQRTFDPSFGNSMRVTLGFFSSSIVKAFGIRSVAADVHNFFTRIVDEMVSYREKNGVERADMLNLLIKLKNEGFVPPDAASDEGATRAANGVDREARQTLSQKEIAAQVFVFFIAGFETTSTTSSFALYELAKHPDIQDKVIEELDAVIKKHGGKVTYDAIMDLAYMETVIQETLRLYPAVPFLNRETMVRRQLPLTDVTLDKGTRLMIPVLALHTDPQYWPEPERFDPTRFAEDDGHGRHSMVYMPFGDGPRICIGMRLGLVQVKMALLTILSRGRVSLAPGMPRKLTMTPRSIVPKPVEGIRLVLTAR